MLNQNTEGALQRMVIQFWKRFIARLKGGTHNIPVEAIQAAKENINGWVYKIEGNYDPNDAVPSEAIVGAWKVDANGEIVGKFIPNPNYSSKDKEVR